MEQYDYREAVKSDVLDYIKNRNVKGFIDEDFRQKLNDDMFVSDSVTGNGSGSYTCNSWQAEENICHNWDLIRECAEEFGMSLDVTKSAEHWDVVIRCHLLNQCVTEVVNEWNAEHPEDDEDEEDEETERN